MSQNVNNVIKHMNYHDRLYELTELARHRDNTRANELYRLLFVGLKKDACDYPDEIGVLKFEDGSYEVYTNDADTPPAVKYERVL